MAYESQVTTRLSQEQSQKAGRPASILLFSAGCIWESNCLQQGHVQQLSRLMSGSGAAAILPPLPWSRVETRAFASAGCG